MTENLNRQRIAKNTIMLYFRMFLTMGVGLYTSRVVLQALGASDYGLYNLVGGFVSMLAYLNSVFVGSTQRFLTYALGKEDEENLKNVFSTVLIIHYCLAFLIFVIAETFGIWFINNGLNINPDRMLAAHWVFQCSLISLVITIISIPYNASIVSHENMHVYAYISIIDVLLKLGIVFLLLLSPYDNLITFAFLQLIVSMIIRVICTIYCKRKFVECCNNGKFNISKFKEIATYSGWVMIGNLGFTFKDQLSNIVLNHFFGTIINASRGIASQVNGLINTFAQNFFMAMSPQITKQYAAGNIQESKKLVFAASKFTFFLLLIVSIPAIINMPYLLKLWLGQVPSFTYEFMVITIVATLLGSLSNAITTALQATGDVKVFQIGISIIMLAEVPLAYIILNAGYAPPYAVLPSLFTNFVGVIFRYIILQKKMPSYYYYKDYFVYVLFRCFATGIVCSYSCYLLFFNSTDSFTKLLISTISCICITSCVIISIGLTTEERIIVIRLIKTKILKK